MPAARPLDTTPAYGIWQQQNAVFGDMPTAWSTSTTFAPEGEEPYEIPTFRRSNAFPVVAEEVRAVREAVGLNEVHNFGKYEFAARARAVWLDRIMAGRIPAAGRLSAEPDAEPEGPHDRRLHRRLPDSPKTCSR